MARKAIEAFSFGGVDTRSNPINQPASRFLYCRNFVPKLDGELDLRDGYTLLNVLKTLGITVGTVDLLVGGDITPTLALSTYYFQVAPVFNGRELGLSKVFGPVTLSTVVTLGVPYTRVPLITFSASQLADSYNIYFGTSTTTLTQLINAPALLGSYALAFTGDPVTTPVVGAVAIHSQIPYTTGDGTRYVLYWQGTTPLSLRISDMTVFLPPVRETQIASSNRFTYAPARNGHLLAFNGTDKKWFDGTLWRDVGIRAPSAEEIDGIVIGDSVREPTSTEATATTVTASSTGGSFAKTTNSGYQVYMMYFDTAVDVLGPSRPIGSRITFAAGTTNKLQIASAPSLAGINGNWVKLFAVTRDGQDAAGMCLLPGFSGIILDRAFGVVTGNCAVPHGMAVGSVVLIEVAGDATFNGVFKVQAVPTPSTFTYNNAGADANTTATEHPLLMLSNTGTSINITDGRALGVSASIVGNADRGLPVPTGTGYQFYLAYQNRVTQHVGNRVAIGGRYVPTNRTNPYINLLPNLSGVDTEWVKLVGRTVDSGAVPNIIADDAGNWIAADNSESLLVIEASQISGDSEMPTRNGEPLAFDKVWREADKLCGVTPNSASVYRCGSEADSVNGLFVGLPEQSWAPNDLETFPTAEHINCGAPYNQESWCYSQSDLAILQELAGELLWSGPFNASAAGRFCFARGWKNLPYWISKEKQFLTASSDGPVPVSDEYDAGLLSQIGDAYLDQTQPIYFRDASRHIDAMLIKCRDASGNPFLVIHDYSLRDDRSTYGQAYEAWYLGALASDFELCYVRDANGKGQIWAGGSDGNFYQLFTGTTDNGLEFTADAVSLVYGGPYNQSINQIEWYGDENLKLSFTTDLTVPFDITRLNDLSDEVPTPVAGEMVDGKGSPHYVMQMEAPEFTHGYLWARLTSHSADGDLSLSSPPHFPLETYGRIYGLVPLAGTARGK